VRQTLQQANGSKAGGPVVARLRHAEAQALLDLAHGELRAASHLLDLRGSDAA
jgi:hypothetical protein